MVPYSKKFAAASVILSVNFKLVVYSVKSIYRTKLACKFFYNGKWYWGIEYLTYKHKNVSTLVMLVRLSIMGFILPIFYNNIWMREYQSAWSVAILGETKINQDTKVNNLFHTLNSCKYCRIHTGSHNSCRLGFYFSVGPIFCKIKLEKRIMFQLYLLL